MKYVHFYGSTMYAGTDYEDFNMYDDNVSEFMINEESNEYAYGNADTYSYLATGWDSDFESEEEEENYYSDCLDYCGWEYITQEEYYDATQD